MKSLGKGLAAICIVAFGATGSPANAIEVLRDIDTGIANVDSNPHDFVQVGSDILFGAADPDHGPELYVTDGTAAGTHLLVDINPGADGSYPDHFLVVGSVLYFSATDATNGRELWRSDGTAAGTYIVANIGPGAQSGVELSGPQSIVAFGGRIYFPASDGAHGQELWRSDGTAAGTAPVGDLNPGAQGSLPSSLTVWNGRLYFVAAPGAIDVGDGGFTLYSSDGTLAGTRQLGALALNGGQSAPALVGTTNLLYLRCNPAANGNELCATDGTSAGTRLVKDIQPGATPSSPTQLVGVGDRLYFIAFVPGPPLAGDHSELWTSDGTAAGTVALTDAFANQGTSLGAQFVMPFGTKALMIANTATASELWISDGTPANTMRLATNLQQSGSAAAASVAVLGPRFVFLNDDGAFNGQLNVSDGTVAGTSVIANVPGGSTLYATGSSRAFIATGYDWPWVTDGTVAGTQRLRAYLQPTGFGNYPEASTVGTSLYFSAWDGGGMEPWRSDGTVAGTISLGDLASPNTTGPSFPRSYVDVNGQVFFIAYDGTTGTSIWRSDGTTASTVSVSAATGQLNAGDLHSAGSYVLYMSGAQLWRNDGTPAGTTQVYDFSALYKVHMDSSVVTVGGLTYLRVEDPLNVIGLWVTDGTNAGTHKVTPAAPAADFIYVSKVYDFKGQALFFGQAGSDPSKLWTTDGTTAGTVTITDTAADYGVSTNTYFYFGAGSSLSRTDGTSAGTQRLFISAGGVQLYLIGTGPDYVVYSVCSGTGPCNVYSFADASTTPTLLALANAYPTGATVGNALVFPVSVCTNNSCNPTSFEVWRTDGSAAGTGRLLRIGPFSGVNGALLEDFTSYRGAVVFTGPVGDNEYGLWRSDGTPGGTSVFYAPGCGFPNCFTWGPLTVSGENLYVTGHGGDSGDEPFVVRRGQPSASPDVIPAANTGPTRLRVLANDSALIGALNTSSLAITTQPLHGTASVDTGSGEVVYTPDAGFFGEDVFSYSVNDLSGATSNIARTAVDVAAPAGTAVVVTAPTLTLSATPSTVTAGSSQAIAVTWSSADASTCDASGGWGGSKATSGSENLSTPAATTTLTLLCSGPGGSISRSVTITVNPASGGGGGGGFIDVLSLLVMSAAVPLARRRRNANCKARELYR
jgi:ELWxxDGT repeat protein